MKNKVSVFFFCFLFSIGFARRAYAYLDPGSGSYIFQIIVAGLLAGSFFIKTLWQKTRLYFKSLFSRRKDAK